MRFKQANINKVLLSSDKQRSCELGRGSYRAVPDN